METALEWGFKILIFLFIIYIIGTTDTQDCKFECNCKKCREKRGQ